jgi:hypothetical protein
VFLDTSKAVLKKQTVMTVFFISVTEIAINVTKITIAVPFSQAAKLLSLQK